MSSEPVLGAVALGAACKVIDLAGQEAITRRISATMDLLEDGLQRSGCQLRRPWKNKDERAGILTFRVPGQTSETLVEHLRDRGLVLVDRAGWLRASPHATTTEESVSKLLEELSPFLVR
jgi:selenocysteine lyase/cysteine desulfurase